MPPIPIDRRTALQLAGAALITAPAAAPLLARDEAPEPPFRRAIPSTGEQLAVIGVGTNRYNPTTDEERASRKSELAGLTVAGESVIDTAPSYCESERLIG